MFAQYFAIEKKIKNMGYDIDRKTLIEDYTNGRTDSLKGLKTKEYNNFITELNKIYPTNWKATPENKMRQKVYALFVFKMNYTDDEMNEWCVKYSVMHKPLNEYKNRYELASLVTQVEAVYASFISSTTKK